MEQGAVGHEVADADPRSKNIVRVDRHVLNNHAVDGRKVAFAVALGELTAHAAA